jgi:K(+)-stimulated pyrophosphate-energized sodium pump
VTIWHWLVIVCGALALLYGIITTRTVMAAPTGTDRMRQIAAAIQEGARAYLNRQYTTIGLVGIVIAIILWATLGLHVMIGYLIGAILSGAAGYIGMNVSVRANVRTAEAARQGLKPALAIAFQSGAITGFLVVGLGLLGVASYYFILRNAGYETRPILEALVALSFGASLASAAASSPRVRTSAPTSSARSKPASPRMIPAIPPSSPITSATMSAIAPAWRPTCSKPMR